MMKLKLFCTKFLVSPPFPGTHASPAPLALRSAVSHSRESYDELSASGILHQEEYDAHVAGFSFSPQGSAWGYFYMFANTFLHFLIGLQLQVTTKFILRPLHMLDTISSFLLVSLKPSSRYIAHL